MPDTPPSASVRYAQIDHAYGMHLATTAPEDDGPIWMVNLMKYRDVADYTDGRESTISGREADDIYAPLEVLADIGAELVFVADVEEQLFGDDTVWDRVAIAKYPTRRSFVEMQSRPDFQEKHIHKDAGMLSTIVAGCLPIPGASDELGRHTAEGDAVIVLDVLNLGAGAAAHAAPGIGWFTVEGTILGDGRTWDQVRLREFPNKAAYHAAEPQQMKRDPATSYTMLVRPFVNHLAESIK